MQITVRQLDELEQKLKNKDSLIKRVREEADQVVLGIVRTVEVTGTAFGLGVVNGRYGSPSFLGMPVDLLTGVAGHALAFFDIAPDHLHSVGDGGLASYTTALGTGIGLKMRDEAVKAAAALAASAAPKAP